MTLHKPTVVILFLKQNHLSSFIVLVSEFPASLLIQLESTLLGYSKCVHRKL